MENIKSLKKTLKDANKDVDRIVNDMMRLKLENDELKEENKVLHKMVQWYREKCPTYMYYI